MTHEENRVAPKKNKWDKEESVVVMAITDFFVALIVVSRVIHLLNQAGVL
jgi:hypothetical protein